MVAPDVEKSDEISLTHEQAWERFSEKTHAYLGMSADEFVRRHEAGELPDSPDVEYLLAVRDYAA